MEIRVTQEKGRVPITVFHIKGALDVTTDKQLVQQAQEAFDAGARNMLLDLSDVAFISSTGLRTIHSIFLMLQTDSTEESEVAVRKGIGAGTFKSAHLKLLNPSKGVLKVLEMAGFDMFLEIYSSQRKALASY
jgi:anti-anti-sigma factor